MPSDLMIIHNGDHAEFEIEYADVPLHERPDWPLPSFDARDWAAAFVKQFPTFDEGTALAWFAGALMRGYDEANARHAKATAIAETADTPATPPADDGWTAWEGGECPVTTGTLVEARLADGYVCMSTPADKLQWMRGDPFAIPIVAYRIVEARDE